MAGVWRLRSAVVGSVDIDHRLSYSRLAQRISTDLDGANPKDQIVCRTEIPIAFDLDLETSSLLPLPGRKDKTVIAPSTVCRSD